MPTTANNETSSILKSTDYYLKLSIGPNQALEMCKSDALVIIDDLKNTLIEISHWGNYNGDYKQHALNALKRISQHEQTVIGTANNKTIERKEEILRRVGNGVISKSVCLKAMEYYARAVALASLKEAAENATVSDEIEEQEDGKKYILTSINKSSITDEKNIKLL